MKLIEQMLIIDEGIKLKPYRDIVGNLTIGVGRNLYDVGITEDEALYLLNNDIKKAKEDVKKVFGEVYYELDPVRQSVLIDMMFNLGLPRFLTFKNFIKAVKEKNFLKASQEMLDSRWAKQVKKRAERLSYIMRTGKIHPDYGGYNA